MDAVRKPRITCSIQNFYCTLFFFFFFFFFATPQGIWDLSFLCGGVCESVCVCVCVCVCARARARSQSCPTLLRPHGLQRWRFLCPWDYPDKNTEVGCHDLLQGIFPAQGSNSRLLRPRHCRQILYRWTTGEAHWAGYSVTFASSYKIQNQFVDIHRVTCSYFFWSCPWTYRSSWK